jgi:lysophospholipase L1-like esterase
MKVIKAKHIVFFGDSICVGQWVSIGRTWVTKTAFALENNKSNEFAVHNRSINGNTTRQALERMHFDVLSHDPYGVIIQFGLNDATVWADNQGHPRVSPNAYKENILEMINRCRHHKVEMIILNSNHPTTRTYTKLPNTDETYETRNQMYYEVLRDLAQTQKDVFFFDIHELFKQNVKEDQLHEYLLEDEIHLSEKGHDFYFKHFGCFISDVMKIKLNNESLMTA